MTTEMPFQDIDCDSETLEILAANIIEKYNTGAKRLTSIKVIINPEFRKANIYAEYEDAGRCSGSGSEDINGDSCEAIIAWPHFKCSENIKERWTDLSFPLAQMKRARMLADRLNKKFLLKNYSDNLKCYFENGKPHIDRL